ncbi:hypothetical protein BJY18_002671 [Amycolatopsis jiangsuensis]|uniref:Uncharacterized protein n=1 Tax=Amycolatopsis jiangsuensis TaxID=1181879 RepID=A0A840IS12_9PSEU|nr:hypothetical protein [Amycolatopsis jiangsuensis]
MRSSLTTDPPPAHPPFRRDARLSRQPGRHPAPHPARHTHPSGTETYAGTERRATPEYCAHTTAGTRTAHTTADTPSRHTHKPTSDTRARPTRGTVCLRASLSPQPPLPMLGVPCLRRCRSAQLRHARGSQRREITGERSGARSHARRSPGESSRTQAIPGVRLKLRLSVPLHTCVPCLLTASAGAVSGFVLTSRADVLLAGVKPSSAERERWRAKRKGRPPRG